ncbi:MAG: glycosyltransferase family 4 protein [Actinomycetota bacterium]|nr:glycosyltransferase family 4 protein [Actinomycetota bacterium]
MRLLFVVQRYGAEVAGGAETFCRLFAERLAVRAHDVDVLTSCALRYIDWENHYPAGTSELDGVTVHRLPVGRPREDRLFEPLHRRIITGQKPIPLHLQEAWMQMQGPYLPDLQTWLADHAAEYDVVVFFTYLYYSTWVGLPAASGVTTTVLHPTAHDEPTLYLPIFDFLFRLPHGLGFLSEEEVDLVRRRFNVSRPFTVTGIGVDLDGVARGADDEASFRRDYGLGDAPYLLYVGRIDPHKGSVELFDAFVAYKARNPGPLRLVIVGDPVRPLSPHDDIVVTGFVSEATKHAAMAGCLAFVHPSYFESFSIVLCEAWSHNKPALVQGRCDVLTGMARRSGGGIPYVGYREFEAAVDLVTADTPLRLRLGTAGRSYVEARYQWDVVIDKYERFLESLASRRPTRFTTVNRFAAPPIDLAR